MGRLLFSFKLFYNKLLIYACIVTSSRLHVFGPHCVAVILFCYCSSSFLLFATFVHM